MVAAELALVQASPEGAEALLVLMKPVALPFYIVAPTEMFGQTRNLHFP